MTTAYERNSGLQTRNYLETDHQSNMRGIVLVQDSEVDVTVRFIHSNSPSPRVQLFAVAPDAVFLHVSWVTATV